MHGNKGRKFSEEHKRKMAVSHLGIKASSETIKKLSDSHKGKHYSRATEFKKGEIANEKHPMWKGGLPECRVCGKSLSQYKAKICRQCLHLNSKRPANKRIRESKEYRLWRKSVFERDAYRCIWCGVSGVEINADHIKPFAYFPELRFAIDNGRTLCIPCHRTTDTWGRKYIQ